jgi:uncharacterized membrane protein
MIGTQASGLLFLVLELPVSAVTAKDRHPAANAQTLERSSGLFVWVISAAFALSILAAIIGAPLLQSSGHPAFAFKIYRAFSFLCHQIPQRSFHLHGNKFAVCSRCTGIYAGIALVAVAYPLARSLKRTDAPRLVWLFLAAAPLAIDWSLGYFSIWENNHASRFATGFLLGGAAVFYILPGLIELSSRLVFRRSAGEI